MSARRPGGSLAACWPSSRPSSQTGWVMYGVTSGSAGRASGCQCGTAMTCEQGIAKNRYRCRSHGTANRQSTVSSDRVDQLVIEWVGALATEPLWGNRAREESRAWAESQWRLARELATQLSAV